MSEFRNHKYEWSQPFTSTSHQWSFRGPLGGVSFSASLMPADSPYNSGPSCGLEFHHSARAAHINGAVTSEAPSHAPCWLLGEPCWHDGTSLYASEHCWPYIESYLRTGDHPAIFRFLEGEYRRHFQRSVEDEA